MKKVLSFLFIGIVFSLTSCVYLGLFPNEVKKHNSAIKDQVPNFSFENFDIEFYNFPDEDKTVAINCVEGVFELLIFDDDKMYYNHNGEEISYEYDTQEEVMYQKSIEEYSYYRDALALIEVIYDYQSFSNQTRGRRAMDEDEDGYLDEVTHYFYDMEWEYGDGVELDFYVTQDTSKIKRIFFRDYTDKIQLLDNPKRHYIMHAYLNPPEDSYTLKDTYENQKRFYEEEVENNKDKVDLSFFLFRINFVSDWS